MTIVAGPIPEEWLGETLALVWARAQRFASDAGAARSPSEAEHLRRIVAAPGALSDDAAFVLHLFAAYDTALVFSTLTANDDPATVGRLLDDPGVLPGFNDSGAHLTHMAFYDANLRGLQWAQAKPQGPGLEAVARHVRRLTAEPAAFFGVHAGRLASGWPADVTVIDPARLARRNFDAPGRRAAGLARRLRASTAGQSAPRAGRRGLGRRAARVGRRGGRRGWEFHPGGRSRKAGAGPAGRALALNRAPRVTV